MVVEKRGGGSLENSGSPVPLRRSSCLFGFGFGFAVDFAELARLALNSVPLQALPSNRTDPA